MLLETKVWNAPNLFFQKEKFVVANFWLWRRGCVPKQHREREATGRGSSGPCRAPGLHRGGLQGGSDRRLAGNQGHQDHPTLNIR